MTQTTEAIFAGASYTTKGGWSVRFMLPDAEAAGSLDARGSGQRYYLALIPIDDDETTPDLPKAKRPPLTYSQRAAMMIKDPRFVEMVADNYDVILTPDMGGEWLKQKCGIDRKRDLDNPEYIVNAVSRELFLSVELEWDLWTGRVSGPR